MLKLNKIKTRDTLKESSLIKESESIGECTTYEFSFEDI